jgi:subtilisin family serine protease
MSTRRSLLVFAAAMAMMPALADAQRPTTTIGPMGRDGAQRGKAAGRFIVTLREGVDPAAVAAEVGAQPDHVYRNALRGFGGTVSEIALGRLRKDPRVLRIEEDAPVTAYQTSTPSWGLDRIDQRSLPLNGQTTRTYTGSGVTIYIVDSGIRYDHVEFGGRASGGYDAFGGDGGDCNGHGTHVAGMAAGSTYGVANAARLVSVRVLDCNGSGLSSGVIAGLDWIAANRRLPAVVNVSLGGPAVQALDDAVARLTASGALVVAAAGNEATDACLGSPARVPSALTVGASDNADRRGSFSNYGTCVDLFAPGVTVPGPYHTSSTALVYMSGTSTASPHVAGVVALMLQQYGSLTPQQAHDSIRARSTKGVIADALSANNHLLFSLASAMGTTAPSPTPAPTPAPAPSPVPNVAPAASFTVSCTNLTCTFTDRSTDADGSIVGWNWAFGSAGTSTARNPTFTFPAAGTYTVTLRVTDDKGATGSSSGTFTLSPPPPPPINISLRASRSGSKLTVDISWSGASGTYVDLYRNGARFTTTANDGHYRDVRSVSGSGSITYKVCLQGTSTCSGNATLRY